MSILLVKSNLALQSLLHKLNDAKFPVRVMDGPGDRIVAHLPQSRRQLFLDLMCGFMMDEWMSEYMRGRLAAEHGYLDAEQREYIVLLLKHALRRTEPEEWLANDTEGDPSQSPGPDSHQIRWAPRIRFAVDDIIIASNQLDLDGLARFRLRDFISMLDAAVEGMVYQFLTDQEYEEFVAMLRYVLDAHTPSAETVHVFCSDERVWLCDDKGELVHDPEVLAAAEEAADEETVNSEDLAMSILVTRSPCRIVIHDITRAAPWPSFAETCERVFLDRTVRCRHCNVCQRLTGSQPW